MNALETTSTRPYLIRALHEWCTDNGFTPYIAVRVDETVQVPMEYVNNGEIVLNVGPLATHQLKMDNDWVLFNARFNGASQEVAVPFAAVIGIFAKETGYGMGFQPTLDAAGTDSTDATPVAATDDDGSAPAGSPPAAGTPPSGKGKVSHLKVVK